MKIWGRPVFLILILALLLGIIASSAWAAMSVATLNGTYHVVNKGSSFWKPNVGSVSDEIFVANTTLKFDGSGGCTVEFSEKEYSVNLSSAYAVSSNPEGGAESCSYSVSPFGEGHMSFADGSRATFWVSVDGNILTRGLGKKQKETDGVLYDTDLLVAVKAGTGKTNASLDGTYHMVSLESDFSTFNGSIIDFLYANNVILTFDGDGSCTYTITNGLNLDLNLAYPQSFTPEEDVPDSGECTYTISPTGVVQMTFSDGEFNARLSNDNNTLLAGGGASELVDDGIRYNTDMNVGVKVRSPDEPGMNNASVNSTFHLVWHGKSFEKNSQTIIDNIKSSDPVDETTITFEGDGHCEVSYTDVSFNVDLSSPNNVSSDDYDSGTESCTYEVDSITSAVAVTFADDSTENFQLSTNGNILLGGGPSVDDDLDETDYMTSMIIAVNAGAKLPKSAPPSSIIVPAGDADGSYQISWGTSPTGEVTYVLEEALDSDFSSGLRKVYRGNGTSVNLTGRSPRNYYYRVKATKLDHRPSLYLVGANSCAVPGTNSVAAPATITVPTADSDGDYTVAWGASITDGVTYVLEEATNSTFTSGRQVVYEGSGLQVNLSNRAQDTTYYYRVKGTKTEWKESAWQTTGAGCAVPGILTVERPVSITVPAGDADGKYIISWGATATTEVGVSYLLEEATNPTFTTGKKVVYAGVALQKALKRALNKTYYYRVRAIKAGWQDSDYRIGNRGCAVTGSSKVAKPGSITVPFSDSDGNYTVSWAKSSTGGVKYVLEEAVSIDFTAGWRVAYFGTSLNMAIADREQDTTYYYRVRAVKPGMKDSGYQTGGGGCTVSSGPI